MPSVRDVELRNKVNVKLEGNGLIVSEVGMLFGSDQRLLRGKVDTTPDSLETAKKKCSNQDGLLHDRCLKW
jgi:hypothetical protein